MCREDLVSEWTGEGQDSTHRSRLEGRRREKGQSTAWAMLERDQSRGCVGGARLVEEWQQSVCSSVADLVVAEEQWVEAALDGTPDSCPGSLDLDAILEVVARQQEPQQEQVEERATLRWCEKPEEAGLLCVLDSSPRAVRWSGLGEGWIGQHHGYEVDLLLELPS